MQRYISGLNFTNPALGVNSGAQVTTGTGNLFLGNGAGSQLTTGSHNTLVGSYAGTPALTETVCLSNGKGKVVCAWDASGTPEQPLQDAVALTAPADTGSVRTGYNTDYGALVHLLKHPDGTVRRSYSATKASVDFLGVDAASLGGAAAALYQKRADTVLTTSGTGTTLVSDGPTLKLRGVAVDGGGIELDDTNGAVVTLRVPLTTLSDETSGTTLPANAVSLVGSTSGLGNTLRTKQVAAGEGIEVVDEGSFLKIQNTQTSAGVTLANDGMDPDAVSLVSDGVGPRLGVCGLVGGTGVGVTLDAAKNSVKIASTVTLASETAAGESLVSVGSGDALRTKYLAVGDGLTIVRNGTIGLTLSNSRAIATLTGAGGDVSLVAAGNGPALSVKGLTAGYQIGLTEDANNAILVRSNSVVTVPIQPVDVAATYGQLRVVPQGIAVDIGAWPIDAVFSPLQLPAIRYLASGATTHSGTMLCAVHGLPGNASAHGFRLLVTVMAPADTAAVNLALVLTTPCPADGVANTWGFQSFSGTLSLAQFTSGGTAPPPPQVCEVALTATTTRTSPPTIACVDDTTLPRLPLLGSQIFTPSPVVMALQLTGSAALTQNLDITGMALVLVPAKST